MAAGITNSHDRCRVSKYIKSDQKVVIDKVFSHNSSRILNSNSDQLLMFVTGGAGVGKSFLIRTIKEMLIRTQQQLYINLINQNSLNPAAIFEVDSYIWCVDAKYNVMDTQQASSSVESYIPAGRGKEHRDT